MSIYDKKYYIDGKEVDLPRADFRYITKTEFKRVIEEAIKGLKKAIERMPEVEQIIRDFDGRPAKAKFKAALEEKGFAFNGRSIYMPMESNCVLADNGKEVIAGTMLESSRHSFEKGIEMCGFIKTDEEDLIDADRTLAEKEDEDTIFTNKRWLSQELKGLTCPDADKWIDKMFEARELLREIHRNAPDELKYRLFGDVLDDAGSYC